MPLDQEQSLRQLRQSAIFRISTPSDDTRFVEVASDESE